MSQTPEQFSDEFIAALRAKGDELYRNLPASQRFVLWFAHRTGWEWLYAVASKIKAVS